MPTADTIPRDEDLPPFDAPKVQLVFEILCDDTPPPDPEHRWESWYAKRIVAALFPRIGPAVVLPFGHPHLATGEAVGKNGARS
jgi:hypothetical protein